MPKRPEDDPNFWFLVERDERRRQEEEEDRRRGLRRDIGGDLGFPVSGSAVFSLLFTTIFFFGVMLSSGTLVLFVVPRFLGIPSSGTGTSLGRF